MGIGRVLFGLGKDGGRRMKMKSNRSFWAADNSRRKFDETYQAFLELALNSETWRKIDKSKNN